MLTTMGDAGGCPGVLVPYEGQCLCPAGYASDLRPGFEGVCVPSSGGGMFGNLKNISLMLSGRTDLVPGSLVPPGKTPGATAPGLAATTSVAAAPSRARLFLWLAIGGVAVTAGVLLLKRRR